MPERYRRPGEELSDLIRQTRRGTRDVQRATGTETAGTKAIAEAAVMSAYDEYSIGLDATIPPVLGWEAETPAWVEGTYVWRRTVTTYGDGSVLTGAPAVMTGNPGASGEDAAVLRIDSTRGTAFKNNAISTELTVTVFAGSQQITNFTDLQARFGVSAFLEWWWRRIDETDFGVIASSDPRLSQAGFKLSVSPADVDEQTVFQCVLHT